MPLLFPIMALAVVVLNLIHYLLCIRTFLLECLVGLRKPLGFVCRKPTLTTVRSDSQAVGKLPIHIGIVIVEPGISYTDIANIIVWAMAMGISYISIYDRLGVLKRNKSSLQLALEKQRSSLQGSDHQLPNVYIHQSRKHRRSNDVSQSGVDVFLLSLEDGRRDLVETTRQLSQAVARNEYKMSDITPTNVDAIVQERHGFPDPDLLLRFGKVDSVMGFLPWQIRLTEMLASPSHHNLDYSTFYQLLLSYSNTEQRLGK